MPSWRIPASRRPLPRRHRPRIRPAALRRRGRPASTQPPDRRLVDGSFRPHSTELSLALLSPCREIRHLPPRIVVAPGGDAKGTAPDVTPLLVSFFRRAYLFDPCEPIGSPAGDW